MMQCNEQHIRNPPLKCNSGYQSFRWASQNMTKVHNLCFLISRDILLLLASVYSFSFPIKLDRSVDLTIDLTVTRTVEDIYIFVMSFLHHSPTFIINLNRRARVCLLSSFLFYKNSCMYDTVLPFWCFKLKWYFDTKDYKCNT